MINHSQRCVLEGLFPHTHLSFDVHIIIICQDWRSWHTHLYNLLVVNRTIKYLTIKFGPIQRDCCDIDLDIRIFLDFLEYVFHYSSQPCCLWSLFCQITFAFTIHFNTTVLYQLLTIPTVSLGTWWISYSFWQLFLVTLVLLMTHLKSFKLSCDLQASL